MFLVTSILFTGLLGIGFLNAFGAKSPYYLTFFGSIALAINLSGIRISNNASQCPEIEKTRTRLGKLVFIHSHHAPAQRKKGHEFKIKDKYFCTGCYGILTGTILSLIFAVFYVGFGFPNWIWPLVWVGAPLSFLPIILRYTLYQDMPVLFRLISNILLPVGCYLIFVIFDVTSQGLITNILLIFGVLIIALLRAVAAVRANQGSVTVEV
jgi:hypothetical protein